MANALLSSLGPLSRAAREGRVSDEIADRIKTYISEGVVSPGERLPAERELAHKLQTSRLSVREAYRSLEEMGLLSIRRGAGGGAFINEVGHAGVTRSLTTLLRLGRTSHGELTEARIVLEPPMAALAARHADAEDIAALEALLLQQEEALKGREGPRRLAMEFHRLVAQAAHNRPLEAMMNSLADMQVEAIATIDLCGVHRPVVSHHRLLFEAIRAGDATLAYELMERHVAEIQERLARNMTRRRRKKPAVTRVVKPHAPQSEASDNGTHG